MGDPHQLLDDRSLEAVAYHRTGGGIRAYREVCPEGRRESDKDGDARLSITGEDLREVTSIDVGALRESPQ